MRISILSNNDLTSDIIFHKLICSKKVKIVAIGYTESINSKKNNKFSELFSLFKKLDFRYFIFLAFCNFMHRVFEKISLFFKISYPEQWLFSTKSYAKSNKIPIFFSRDFNKDNKFIEFLKQEKIDLLVIRINQILKSEILEIPKNGTWCIHSSLLPSYKGIAAEFHALRNQENFIGTSIFDVDLELDKGKPMLQSYFSVNNNRSLFWHIIFNNYVASKLILDFCTNFFDERSISKPPILREGDSYHSWPNKCEVKDFKNKKNKLITYREALHYLFICLNLIKPFSISDYSANVIARVRFFMKSK